MRPREHEGPCLRHRRYHLSCAEFVVLVAAFGSRCGICKIAASDARPAYLVIDHDHEAGDWAVRGMLCSGCNRRIRDGRIPSPEAAAYLAGPWYLRRFAERGISLEPLQEPRAGTIVGGRGSYWYRTEAGWTAMRDKPYGAPQSWAALNYLLGPHNIWIPPRTNRRYQLVRAVADDEAVAS